jgi:hypothetical protein
MGKEHLDLLSLAPGLLEGRGAGERAGKVAGVFVHATAMPETVEMATVDEPNARIPVICADNSAVAGAGIFDPNSWTGASKGIIQSCWTEYSVLHHCVDQIVGMCREPERFTQNQIESIQKQWKTKKFDLGKVVIYGQQPDLHMRIEAFFSGTKTHLDLIVQLLTSENVELYAEVGDGVRG